MGTKTGNPATIIPSTGVVAPPSADPQCQRRDDANQRHRQKTANKLKNKKKKTQEDRKVLGQARGGGMAFASARIKAPGKPAFALSGCSSAKARSCAPSLTRGGSSPVKAGLSSKIRRSKAAKHGPAKQAAGTLCDGYVHPGGGSGAHAEAKIFNRLTERLGPAGLKGVEVVLKVDWRFTYKGKTHLSGMPCQHCFKLMCHAAKHCGIKIMLCDGKNEPQEFNKDGDCDQDTGDPKTSPMRKLDQQMGEHPLKGLGRIAHL